MHIILTHGEGVGGISSEYGIGIRTILQNCPSIEVVAFVGSGGDGDVITGIVVAGTRYCAAILRINSENNLVLRLGLEGGGVGGVASHNHVADSIGVAVVPLYEEAVVGRSGGDGDGVEIVIRT